LEELEVGGAVGRLNVSPNAIECDGGVVDDVVVEEEAEDGVGDDLLLVLVSPSWF